MPARRSFHTDVRVLCLALVLVPNALGQFTQQGSKLVGGGAVGTSQQGTPGSVAVSADGSTAIVGGPGDNNNVGAAWVFARTAGNWAPQGGKLTANNAVGPAAFGFSAAISGDGNTAIMGGPFDNNQNGAAWIFTRTGSTWTQQAKLVGTGGAAATQGMAVSLSSDGNTAFVGGPGDDGGKGAAWVFTRSGTTWTQQGNKLIGSGADGAAQQGSAVALSGNGTTAIIGGPKDLGGAANPIGAVWIFARSGNTWTQQGSKMAGTGANGSSSQGSAVALSSDGNTALAGGPGDNVQTDGRGLGAAWVFTRSGSTWSQQGNKLAGSGNVGGAGQGSGVALSGDGNTALIGGNLDNNAAGATWVFTRSGVTWAQAQNKLVGSGAVGIAVQGTSVALSADGSTAIVGAPGENNVVGAAWVFVQSVGAATRFSVVGPASAAPGAPVTFNVTALDASGKTATGYTGTVKFTSTDATATLPGNSTLTNGVGSFSATLRANGNQSITATDVANASITGTSAAIAVSNLSLGPSQLSPPVSSGTNQVLTVTYNAPGGFETLDVINVLINNFLDGRQACYLAYSRPSNVLYIVADNGDSNQISGKVMDGTGTVGNSQCTVTLAGSSASGTGTTFTLTLNLTFAASFGGNKVVYAAARNLSGGNSGWQTMGVHGVPPLPSTFPNPVGLSPSSGTTASQTITFTYQDQSAATNLQTAWALINTALDGRSACYVAYYRPGNQLFLFPDNGDGSQATNIVLTGNNTISNSQCTVSAQGASVQSNGNTLAITLPITFKPAFAGFKDVWMAVTTMGNAQTSQWQALGAETVPGQ